MGKEKAIIVFNNIKLNTSVDIEVPLDITATELVFGLNAAYDLGIDTSAVSYTHLRAHET